MILKPEPDFGVWEKDSVQLSVMHKKLEFILSVLSIDILKYPMI
jgi:hypothetical protein